MRQRTNLKIPFALKDGEIVHVEDVERGLACGCFCPACGASLVARKGDETQHHFAHHGSDSCEHAYETTLHYLAKEIILAEKKVMVPPVIACVSQIDLTGKRHELTKSLISEPTEYPVDHVALEKKLGGIVPDVIVEVGGRQLLVEVAVTHFIDKEKERRIRDLGIASVEIDLSDMRGLSSRDEIAEALFDWKNSFWVFNPKKNEAEKALRQDLQRRVEAAEKRMRTHLDELERLSNPDNFVIMESVYEARIQTSPYIPLILDHFRVSNLSELPSWVGRKSSKGFIFDCHAKIWQAMVIVALKELGTADIPVVSRGKVVAWMIKKSVPVHQSVIYLWGLKKRTADIQALKKLPSYKEVVGQYLDSLERECVVSRDGFRYMLMAMNEDDVVPF